MARLEEPMNNGTGRTSWMQLFWNSEVCEGLQLSEEVLGGELLLILVNFGSYTITLFILHPSVLQHTVAHVYLERLTHSLGVST